LALPLGAFDSACRYTSSARFVFLLGHWSAANRGCLPGMDTRTLAQTLGASSGPCGALARQGRLLFLMGHQHRNEKFVDGGPDAVPGFQVAGMQVARLVGARGCGLQRG
jgi:hypothetical protein